MKNLYRRGLGGLLTWIFIGITALYVAFIFGKHLVVGIKFFILILIYRVKIFFISMVDGVFST